MYEWGDLRIFLAVARAGSALAAAHELDVNQSTVSRRIQALEHALDLTLFDRQNRGHTLTEHGKALLASVQQVARATADVQSAAERLRRAVFGVVRVTAPEAIAKSFIIQITAAFQQLHPDVRVDQVATDSRLDIVHGEADVAFRASSHPDDPRLVVRRLPDIAWAVYCSQNYANTHGYPSDITKLARHAIIEIEGAMRALPGYQWFISHADTARTISRSNTVPNMNAVLQSGLGVGMLPCSVGDLEPALIRCFDPPDEMRAEFWMVTSQEAQSNAQVRAFIDFAAPRIYARKRHLSGETRRRDAS
jgi:DNA-binding transcriptional LysR family regulator